VVVCLNRQPQQYGRKPMPGIIDADTHISAGEALKYECPHR
jgi:hypothetical protein